MLEDLAVEEDERRPTVDTAHLLSKHDSRGTVVGTSDSRDAETIPETGKVVQATCHLQFLLVNDVRVVVISGTDNGMGTQFHHGTESLSNLSMLHEPTRGLGTEPDTQHEDEGRNKCGTELETPGDATGVLDNDIGSKTQEDTCGERLAMPRRALTSM